MKDKMKKWADKARTAIKWVAVDANGNVYGYDTKPNAGGFKHLWVGGENIIPLGTTYDKYLRKNWDKTLRKVNYE